jgi:tetratricopeptide (TPR) repeat protein
VLLLPLVLLCCIEILLRVIGVGYPTTFFLKREVAGRKVLVENDKFGWRFFGPDLARTPRPMELSPSKPARTCRIFVFGESAAYGDPKPEFGLPRFLEVLLRGRFPGVQFEIVNAAMTGINSHVILPIARDCASQDGDVWVIYMGNNEVVGPFGSGTIFGKKTPSMAMIRGSIWLRGTRVGELLANFLNRSHRDKEFSEWEGMAMFVKNQVRYDDPRMAVVYSHFQRNLKDIISLGRSHGAKIVLSTVCSNLKDCAPFGSEHRVGFDAEPLRQWQELFETGKQAETTNQFERAIELFSRGVKLDPDHAELQFRLGRCLLRAGRTNDALEHFSLARDRDTLRFRADSSINRMIRETAGARAGNDFRLVDSELELGEDGKIVGDELLYEHVHFNFHGNYRLSVAIASQVAALLPSWMVSAGLPNWLSEEECARRLAWTDWDRHRSIKSVLLRLAEAPFTAQCDHDEHVARLAERLTDLIPSQRPPGLRQALATYEQAATLAPQDWVLQRDMAELLRALGDLQGAQSALRKSIELLPHDPGGHLELALLLVQAHRPQQALEEFSLVLQQNPRSVPALNGLALAQGQLGKQSEAIDTLKTALKIKPGSADTHMNLGTAFEVAGQKDEARRQYEQAIRNKLTSPELLIRAGRLCMSQGWVDLAITNFSKAVALNPADANAHWYLGGVLDTKGKTIEAQRQFQQAVRLDPELAGAHLGLGIELSRQNLDPAAADEFRQALKIDPSLLDARLRLGISLARQKQLDAAQQQFEQVLSVQPTNAIAQKYLLLLAKQRQAHP